MKKLRILFLTASILSVSLCANAEVSVGQTTSAEYLKNSGYSQNTADLVDLQKHRATGTATVEAPQKTLPVRWFKKIHTYLDPSLDDGTFGKHDIKPSPSSTDL